MGIKNCELRVSIIGTNGIPACYGGFETLAENLSKHLDSQVNLTIFCSRLQKKYHYLPGERYGNTTLVYSRWEANGFQSVIYDCESLIRSSIKDDVIIYLGPVSGFLIPLLRFLGCKKNIIVNHGGLNEWEREKMSFFERKLMKFGAKCAARYSSTNIVDNKLYRDSIKKLFGADSIVIRYGGNHVKKTNIDNELLAKYPFLNHNYAVSVSRAQIDNNLHILLEAYSNMPQHTLVLISNWNISDYGRKLKSQYGHKYSNIIILDAIYNQREINAIRGNAEFYIHSHSRCGTAPSLCEAMFLGLAIVSYDVPVNHETTQENALFFKDVNSLMNVVNNLTPEKVMELAYASSQIAAKEYNWKHIADQYLECINNWGYRRQSK